MANEIKLGYSTGETLTYAVYNPDGTEVTAPGTSLPEIGSTGYYTATDASIAAGDVVIISDTVGVLFQGEYQPEVVSTALSTEIAALDAKIDVIDGIVDAILVDTGTTLNDKIDVIDGIVDAILVDTGTTLDDKIDTIDTNVDLLIVEAQRVNNVYITEPVSTKPRITYL
jgi:hypothetical protein